MYVTASGPPLRDGIESTSKSIPVMPLHSLPSLADPREARVSRASSPVSVCQNTGRSILARGVTRRHPFCVIGPARRTNHARRVMTTDPDGTGGWLCIILSRSFPPAGRAGLGSTGLVRPPVPDRGGRRRQPLRRRWRRPGFTACAGNQRGADGHRLSAGWLICEADGCRRIILTIGSH